MIWQARGRWMCFVLTVVGLTVSAHSVQAQLLPSYPPDRRAAEEAERERKAGPGVQTSIIPSLYVQERYDSNVYFIPGQNLEDYVTSIGPQLKVVHRGQLIEGTISGGANGEVYVKNPGLNYIGTNALLNVNFDKALSELVKGAGLEISDTFYYTPQPPAFATSGTGQIPESFQRGIQAQRRNAFTNGATANASYEVTPLLKLRGIYLDQRIRFGGATFTPPPGTTGVGTPATPATFINTTFQTFTTGPEYKLTPLDVVSVYYQYQKGGFNQNGAETGFTTQGALLGWTRKLSSTFTASIQGGVLVFSGTNDLQYQGTASLTYLSRDTDVTLSYSRAISPSFFTAGVPLLSQIVGATVRYRFTEHFIASIFASYARNESVPDSSLLKFESYSVTPGLEYKFNRVFTGSLSYTRGDFTQEFGGGSFYFARNMVALRLTAEWQ